MKPFPSSDPQSDSLLWTEFKGGNRDALGKLASLHYRALFSYGKRFSTDYEFVQDCIQDLFLGLWERRTHISATEHVKAYLFKALRNKIADEGTRLNRFRHIDDLTFETNSVDVGFEALLIEQEQLEQQNVHLQNAIAQLTKRERELIYLRFYQGLDSQQTAEIMGLGQQSVANLIYKALKKMKEYWASAGLQILSATTFIHLVVRSISVD